MSAGHISLGKTGLNNGKQTPFAAELLRASNTLIGIFKRADVAYGHLITHYHRFVFRKLHNISLPSHFCCRHRCFYWFSAPLSPGGQLQEGTETACSFTVVTAHTRHSVFVESRNDVTGLGL